LLENPPYGAKVVVEMIDGAMGWEAPKITDGLAKAINDASLAFYQKPAVYMGEGGTIPFMSFLGQAFPETQFMITGVLGPHSNAHGPNEFLHIDMVKRVTSAVAYVVYQQTC